MYSHEIDLNDEIKRYETLRDQCDRMIVNLDHISNESIENSFAHAFRDICNRQIGLLKRAVSATA